MNPLFPLDLKIQKTRNNQLESLMSRASPVPKTIRQYVFGEQLGSGTFSTVYKVLNIKNKGTYACKVVPRQNLADEGDQNRFQREINAMAFIRHENLVALHDFFWDDTNFYLVMDLCPGGELFEFMCKNGAMDEPLAALIFRQFASGVACCHSFGVAHRDLKPENILFDVFPRVKVSDFGLCGYITGEIMMQTFCGSPCYCSPECLCRIKYDGRMADVWSLGVILYTMVTGQNPWNIQNTSIMLHQILRGSYHLPDFLSRDCQDLITRMLKVNPSDRCTMRDVLDHPWLKRGDESQYAAQEHPPADKSRANEQIEPVPLSIISQLSEKQSQTSDQGIFSPFQEEDIGPSEVPNYTFPKLCLKDGMLGEIKRERIQGPARYAPVNAQGGVTASRQRSAAVLNGRSNAARLLMPKFANVRRSTTKTLSHTFL